MPVIPAKKKDSASSTSSLSVKHTPNKRLSTIIEEQEVVSEIAPNTNKKSKAASRSREGRSSPRGPSAQQQIEQSSFALQLPKVTGVKHAKVNKREQVQDEQVQEEQVPDEHMQDEVPSQSSFHTESESESEKSEEDEPEAPAHRETEVTK